MAPIQVSSRVTVPASALSLHATRSGGPGGQNVNKVSTKVELRVELGAIVGLSPAQRLRLETAARGRLDEQGRLVITSQLTRSQQQNLEDARDKVRLLVEGALVAPRPRVATKPTRASRQRRLDGKRRRSATKKDRRWSGD